MKRTVLGIFILFLITTVSYGQEPQEGLQLTIKSDKQTYEMGEEINIEASIKNTGKDAVKIYSPDYWGTSEIVVTNSKGMIMKPRGIKVERVAFDEFMIIPSGESRTHAFNNLMWFHCGGAWQFLGDAQLPADSYKIYVTVTNPPVVHCHDSNKQFEKTDLSGTITSGAIPIEVVERKTY